MGALGHTSASLSLEVYARVVTGATKGLGEGMARLVRGPEWAQAGPNDVPTADGVADPADAKSVEVAT